MAWEAYITSNLMAPLDTQGNTLTSSAILGLDGGVWAQSAAFPEFKDEEFATFLQAFDEPSVTSVHIAGVKYMKTSADGKVLRARKDKEGFICRRTNTALVCGFYTEPKVGATTCSKVVEALADYLEEQGY